MNATYAYVFELLQKHARTIVDYIILEPFSIDLYPLKFLGSKHTEPHHLITPVESIVTLDEKDKKLLKFLNHHAHARIIDISKETHLSSELIVYKLKKLKEQGVFLGTRAYFNMKQFGYSYTLIFINFQYLTSANQEKLKRFAKNSPHIESISFTFNKPNCYMQLFYQAETELHQTLIEFKEFFKEESFTLEVIPLKNEGEYINTLPFL